MDQDKLNNQSHYADEIDLVDIWLVVVRHKWLLIGFILLCTALTAAYTVMRTPQYEYVATLEIGGYWSHTAEFGTSFSGRFISFEDTEAVVAKIQNSYGPAARLEAIKVYGAARVPDKVTAKSELKSQTVQLQVTLPVDNAEVAFSLLNTISNYIIQGHAALLQKRQELLEKFFQGRITALSSQIEDLIQSRKAAMQESSSDTKALVLLMVDSRLQELESEKAAVRQELEVSLKTDLKPTRLIFGPAQSPKPAGMASLLVILLGVVVGAILGMFAVMFRQISLAARERSKQS